MYNDLVKRVMCKKKWYQAKRPCHDSEHFHHTCRHCGGTWMEMTFEVYHTEVKLVLRNALKMAINSDLTPDNIQEIVGEICLKDIMES